MSKKKARARLRHCAWIAIIPLLRVNPDFRAWAKRLRERPVQANPLNGREIVGAGINKLFRLGFALVKKQTFYQVSHLETATGSDREGDDIASGWAGRCRRALLGAHIEQAR